MVRFLAGIIGIFPLAVASAAEITVLDPDGRPAPDVAVSCAWGAVALVLTDAEGRSVLPDSCREAMCARGGFVSGRARISESKATCRLVPGLRLRGEVRMERPEGDGYGVALEVPGSRRVVQSVALDRDGTENRRRFRMEPAPPGTYDLRVLRIDDEWSCATHLGPLAAGERDVMAGWREPAEVAGIVRDPEGKPFARVLLRVAYDGEDVAVGLTRCAMWEQAQDVVSDRNGRFHALVDPTRPWRIVVDPAWQPATIALDGAPVRD